MPPCESMRQMEYEKEQLKEQERKRKIILARQRERILERKKQEAEQRKREKERYDKAVRTIKVQSMGMGWLVTTVGKGKFKVTKPYSNDLMEINVLKDGRIQVNTPGKISMPNHASADKILDSIAQKLKGKWNVLKRHFHGVTEGVRHTHTH
jgi:hypothetical protein